MDSSRTSYKDYYYILGVSPEATSTEIQEAYSDLYDRFGPHVNMNGQDPEAMIKTYKDIVEAFETLSDPRRRQQYDELNYPFLQKSNLRQLWGKFTGVDGQQQATTSGVEDTEVEYEITLKEAIKGTIAKVRIDENLPCKTCAGKKPVERISCMSCRGSGQSHRVRQEEIEVPAGAYPGQELRAPGLGKYDSRIQRAADLVVRLKLRQHQYFNVMGRDITCTVPVTILEAVLGGEIEVPTATGKVVMKIMPLTQSGKVYRLKGMGIAGADLLATIEVVVPKQISADEVELFRKLHAVTTIKNPREELLAMLKQDRESP